MDEAELTRQLEQFNRQFFEIVRLNVSMGIRIDGLSRNVAEMTLPYREDLVGDPVTGVLHGGAITALMDACCGAAVFMALPRPDVIATMDLRIDYLRRAEPGQDVRCRAECVRITRDVAFVRAFAYHGDPDHGIAAAAGAFVVGTHMPGVAR